MSMIQFDSFVNCSFSGYGSYLAEDFGVFNKCCTYSHINLFALIVPINKVPVGSNNA